MLDQFSKRIQSAIGWLKENLPEGKWSTEGLLADASSRPTSRYSNVPPEAFPILNLGVDGVHYALWIDDPNASAEPPVVMVSPMDPLPETITIVTSTVDEFALLIKRAGEWLHEDQRAAELSAAKARKIRESMIRYQTLDTMGVVCAEEPLQPAPHLDSLVKQESDQILKTTVEGLLKAGIPGKTLVLLRDFLQRAPSKQSMIGDALAVTYRALKRELLAEIAEVAYKGARR